MKALVWVASHWADLCLALAALVAFATVVTGLLPLSASLRSRTMKAIHWLAASVHSDEPGTFKLPFTNGRTFRIETILASAAGLARVTGRVALANYLAQALAMVRAAEAVTPPARPPMPPMPRSGSAGFARPRVLLAVVVAFAIPALVALGGCAGSTTSVGVTGGGTPGPGGVAWTVGVNIGVTVAKQALPAVQAILDARPEIPAATKAQIDAGFRVANDSLDLARTAFNTYAETPTTANLCRVHFYVDQAITGALQALTIARDAGVTIDPTTFAAAQAALGSLSAIADSLYPSCSSSGAPAYHLAAWDRVRNVLEGLRQ